MGRAKIFLKSSEVLLGALVELVVYLRVQKKKKKDNCLNSYGEKTGLFGRVLVGCQSVMLRRSALLSLIPKIDQFMFPLLITYYLNIFLLSNHTVLPNTEFT